MQCAAFCCEVLDAESIDVRSPMAKACWLVLFTSRPIDPTSVSSGTACAPAGCAASSAVKLGSIDHMPDQASLDEETA